MITPYTILTVGLQNGLAPALVFGLEMVNSSRPPVLQARLRCGELHVSSFQLTTRITPSALLAVGMVTPSARPFGNNRRTRMSRSERSRSVGRLENGMLKVLSGDYWNSRR